LTTASGHSGCSRSSPPRAVTELLEQAFRVLAADKSLDQIPIVIDTLIASGDEETLALCEAAASDKAVFDALAARATELGSNPFDVLDVVWPVAAARGEA
jgi:hypothetical protein